MELYDKLLVVDQDAVETSYALDVGANVINSIADLILSTGEARVSITASAETLRTAMVWEAGTSKLRIINDLLSAINYFSLWVDGYGNFRAEPYVEPSRRGLSWSFFDNAESIYSPDFSHDFDTFKIPNKVILVSQSDGETEALTATAYDQRPDSPFSFEARDRWIAVTETNVEATSQAVLDALAQRRLKELQMVGSTYEISHALIPLDLNALVAFRRLDLIDALGVVQKFTLRTDVGALVTSTIREVTR